MFMKWAIWRLLDVCIFYLYQSDVERIHCLIDWVDIASRVKHDTLLLHFVISVVAVSVGLYATVGEIIGLWVLGFWCYMLFKWGHP